ncbi:hypothetical protein PENSPDRAFT_692682 [Peniophora sp. CONT]|nr:hypothetical protein PENSPDRAFT_692682 [Peniophora sp. CONT]
MARTKQQPLPPARRSGLKTTWIPMHNSVRYIHSATCRATFLGLVGAQVHIAANLATEILQEIFLHLYYSATTTERIWGLFPTWLTPLHVCRTWRVALISYPRLLRYLPLESFRLTQIALTLSENMSLIVDAPPHAPISEDALTIALQHASCVKTLVCPADVTTSRALPELCRLECFNCSTVGT